MKPQRAGKKIKDKKMEPRMNLGQSSRNQKKRTTNGHEFSLIKSNCKRSFCHRGHRDLREKIKATVKYLSADFADCADY